jgi:hypothetical protein
MKNFQIFAIAMLVIFFVSCLVPITEDYEFQIYEDSGKPYDGTGYVYISDSDLNTDKPILIETMLYVGEVWGTGGLNLYLPESVDSLFLAKLDPDTSPGMYTEPLDIEVWFYEKPLKLVKNRVYLGDLEYKMIDENKYHKILYWYFSKDAKINHLTETSECKYSIDARKGWNKVYFYKNIADGKICYTTDLSKAPNGLKWFFTPSANEKSGP